MTIMGIGVLQAKGAMDVQGSGGKGRVVISGWEGERGVASSV